MALTDLESLITNLEAFDFAKEQHDIVEANKDVLADLQAEQLARGRDRNDAPLILDGVAAYSPFTVRYKKEFGRGLGAVTDRVTFFMHGTLYKELFATIRPKTFIMESRVPYFGKLLERAGENAVGLAPDERLKFAETYVIPGIDAALFSKTGLRIKS